MPVTVNDVVAKMRQALTVSEPDLDTSIGTPVRKILDAVAEVVAESSVDTYLLDYQYDIDSKTGTDLDDFVGIFGFARLAAKRATGAVTFERTSAAVGTNFAIAFGTQVATGDATPVVFQTMTPAILLAGDTSVSVPVQALLGGASGNVAANSVQRMITSVAGIASISNPTAMSGGADQESDAQLRDRFKKTVFRNLAGTEQMFLGVALNNPHVTQANVIGASKRHREQLEIVGGTGTSSINDAAYVYDGSAVFGTNIDAGGIFVPGIDYSFDPSTNTVTVLNPSKVTDGVYDLEFEYLPVASRNDPANGVTNRVDLYVNGDNPTKATATLLFRTTRTFNTTPGDKFNRFNFVRFDGTSPVTGNYFVPYPIGPVDDASVDDELVINGITYHEGTDYWAVNDITNSGGTVHSYSGIEFSTLAGSPPGTIPPDQSVFTVDYVFNSVPQDVDTDIRVWRLITTDVQVHAAKILYLNLYLAVMLSSGFSVGAVQPTIEAALSNLISRIGFNDVVQVSDLLGVVQQVPGIDAVRFITQADNYHDLSAAQHWAIERMSRAGTFIERYERDGSAIDVIIGDDVLPVFNAVTLVVKAQNTFFSYLP
jgi:uncharacterized phage protein gp47/JayE